MWLNKIRYFVLGAFGFGVLLSSCTTIRPTSPGNARCYPAGETPFPMEMLSKLHSGLKRPLFATLKSKVEWQSIWSAICHDCDENTPTEPNFETEMVLVAATGEHGGAFRVSIDGAKILNGRIEILVKEEVLGSNCVITTEERQPVAVATIKRSNCPVVFVPTKEKNDC
jgi:hypothetical protein